MGRGTIVSGGTDGLYTVDLDYGSTRADQLIDYLQTAITDIDVAIAAAESVAESASLSLSSVLSALNGAIVTYTGDESSENKEALQEATEAAAEAEVAKEKATVKVSGLKYQKMALESRLASIQAIDVTERADVWCVDLTEDASGSVATIEVNGEGGQGILIAPEGRSPNDGDGYMTAREVQSAEQAFYNAAILPGWQKYAPTYRTGTISNIDYDNDTCSVTLDAAESSAQGLSINQATLLEGVDVEYMYCNAKAFDDGDAVVVQFVGQSWSSPKVIGFVSNPKACSPYEIAFLVEPYQETQVNTIDMGGPRAPEDDPDGVFTYPTGSPVYQVNTITYDFDNPGAPSNEYGNWILGISHTDLRIRFDIAMTRQKSSQEKFTKVTVTDIEEATHGSYYNVDCVADINTQMSAGSHWTLTFDISEMTTELWEGVGGPFDCAVGPFKRISYYNTWMGAGNVYSTAAEGAYHAHMTQYWTPPSTVTLTIEERDFDYELVSFGPVPERLYDYPGQYPYFTYRELGDYVTSLELIRNHFWAIYRRSAGV